MILKDIYQLIEENTITKQALKDFYKKMKSGTSWKNLERSFYTWGDKRRKDIKSLNPNVNK